MGAAWACSTRDSTRPHPGHAGHLSGDFRYSDFVDGSSDENLQLLPGAIFADRYEVARCIKAGGMGAVYEVIHLETRRRRALKVMLPSVISDPDLRARFKLEATVTAEVDSEHIV